MKKFTLTVTDDGNLVQMEAENRGFTTLEIIGMLETKKRDIFKQVDVPTQFTRKIVHEDGTVEMIEEVQDD